MSLIKPFLSLTMLLLAMASVAAGHDAALPAFFPQTDSVAVLFAEDLDVDWQAEVQLTAAPVHAGASALTVTPDQSLNLHTRTPILADGPTPKRWPPRRWRSSPARACRSRASKRSPAC